MKKTEDTTRIVTNIDGVKKEFKTDKEFLEYAKIIYKENEAGSELLFGPSTIHFLPENIQQATEYIVEYCDNLELTEL